ncbi:MAG: hypothetical protein JKY93_11750 [Gammaproteobacteria bacterium]|nr:hypothetical protein [Gammaproteobacteria bacterium]
MTIDNPNTDKKLSELYQSAADELPPASIDNLITAEAKKQAQQTQYKKEKKPFFSPFPENWMLPVSAFALLVLTVGIVQLMPTPQDEIKIFDIPQEESFSSRARTTQLNSPTTKITALGKAKKSKDKAAQLRQPLLKKPMSATAPYITEDEELNDTISGVNKPMDADTALFADDLKASRDQSVMAMPTAVEKQRQESGVTSQQAINNPDEQRKPESRKSLFELKRNEPQKIDNAKEINSNMYRAAKSDSSEKTHELSAEHWLKKIELLLSQLKPAEAREELIKFRKTFPHFKITNKAILKLETTLLETST